MRLQTGLVVAACLAAVSAFAAAPQDATTLRVGGTVIVEGGAPIAGARIRTDALRGEMARPFGGQREFRATANQAGEWSLIGLTRGLWVLEVSAPDFLPHVVIVPISMMLKPEPVVWETTLDAGTTGTMITYLHGGRQFIVVAIGGQTHPPEFIALALP